jgi:hypothetical protein
VVTNLESSVLGVVVPLLVLAPLVLVMCAAIGILYAGAIDPALVLRRSTVWGAIGAAGVILFAGIENALFSLLEERLHLPAFAGAMISGAIVAVMLVPVRARVQRWVNARMAVAAPGEAAATSAVQPVASNRSPATDVAPSDLLRSVRSNGDHGVDARGSLHWAPHGKKRYHTQHERCGQP